MKPRKPNRWQQVDPQTKALQKKWYAKLKKEGFEDLEDAREQLIEYHGSRFGSESVQITKNITEEYYRVAGHFLHDWDFKTATEKVIWSLHADGQTVRDIAAVLKKQRRKHSYRNGVSLVVRRLRSEMIKFYGITNGQERTGSN